MGRSSAASGWGSAEACSISIHLFQIDDLWLRSQVFQQFRGAGAVREAVHLVVGVLQVAEHDRSGGATLPARRLVVVFPQTPGFGFCLFPGDLETGTAKRALLHQARG